MSWIIAAITVFNLIGIVHGQDELWVEWGPWSGCSVTCDVGFKTRYRGCLSSSGKGCRDRDTEFCYKQLCTFETSRSPPTIKTPEYDPEWLNWQEWSTCSKSCGGGIRKRIRNCVTTFDTCTRTQTRGCNYEACPKEPSPTQSQHVWEEWTEWSECSSQCGRGLQRRQRKCKPIFISWTSPICMRVQIQEKICSETKDCNTFQVITGWSSWESWTTCSKTCGFGTQERSRYCQNSRIKPCFGDRRQRKGCQVIDCDPEWDEWESWSDCSSTCGAGGSRKRVRFCKDSDRMCNGQSIQTEDCKMEPCVVDPEWSEWKSWSDCSSTCGPGGSRKRVRFCKDFGRMCNGQSSQTEDCKMEPCVLDPEWREWESWSDCSSTCGAGGSRKRVRFCKDSGRMCNGQSSQTEDCKMEPCVLDPEWSEWESWSDCSSTCGPGGSRKRARICSDSDRKCNGQSSQTEDCEMEPCVVDPEWTEWESWSECSTTCGPGTRTRLRTCEHGDAKCDGSPTENVDCESEPCETDNWSQWDAWSKCSTTCGRRGLKTRLRRCERGVAGEGNCPGRLFEINACGVECPKPESEWQAWSQWSECSATCGDSSRTSSRQCNGEGCKGVGDTTEKCVLPECPKKAEWQAWSPWSECSATCGDSSKTSSRQCNGEGCEGDDYATEECLLPECPKKPKWEAWSSWSECSATCEKGYKTRSRQCNGEGCEGIASAKENCTGPKCPKKCKMIYDPPNGRILDKMEYYDAGSTAVFICDRGFTLRGSAGIECLRNGRWSTKVPLCVGQWATWGNWTECSVTCGSGMQQRVRTCKTNSCIGPDAFSRKCNDLKCPGNNTCGLAGDVGTLFLRGLSAARVVGGNGAVEGAWPWQVLLTWNQKYKLKKSMAKATLLGGGTVLNEKWILTAAHFIESYASLKKNMETQDWRESIFVILGVSRLPSSEDLPASARVFEPQMVILHPDFDIKKTFYDYDVALIKVGRSFKIENGRFVANDPNSGGVISFSDKIRPICLPCLVDKKNDSGVNRTINSEENTCIEEEDSEETKYVVVTGYGKTRKIEGFEHDRLKNDDLSEVGVLKQGLLKIANNKTCNEALDKITKKYFKTAIFTPRMLCTLSGKDHIEVDACKGDSGGPLVRMIERPDGSIRWVQVGLVSWGIGCAFTDEDGFEYPGFFVKLSEVLPFIFRTIYDRY